MKISLDFYTKASSYEEALEKGTKDVEIFINDILESMNFEKEIMSKRTGAQDTIQTIFTPEDVEISETLYCLWTAN